jgi:hypothetical protein
VKRELLMFALASFATICVADDAQNPVPSATTAAQRAARPRQVAAGTRSTALTQITDGTSGSAADPARGAAGNNTANGSSESPSARTTDASASATTISTAANAGTGTTTAANAGTTGATSATAPTDPKFQSEAKWVLAGYNSDEIVYTVFVTNQDPRIIRCTTEVKGFYFENGTKLSIQDRQITTVFPNQPTRVGYWMDMDQQSGASYSVKCHPV